MYLVAIHVPIFVAGPARYLATDWKRSVELLRDSLQGRYGELVLVAPTQPAEEAEQQLEQVCDSDEGIGLVPSIDRNCRPRDYWLRERRRWQQDLREPMRAADVVHTGLSDLYRPINLDALLQSLKLGRPTVFARDTDEVQKLRDMLHTGLRRDRWKTNAYIQLYIRFMRKAVREADLSLLKGAGLYQRYATFAKNPKLFHDTSYRETEIVGRDVIERRLATAAGRPLRLVYAGRFERRKGVDHSVEIIGKARARGAEVEFDIIGDGPGIEVLKRQVAEARLVGAVRFLGRRPYGAEMIRELADYDALLYTPLGEDTPRMIFDGYAAGLPIVGYRIQYTSEREAEEKAAVLFDLGDTDAGADALEELCGRRERLTDLSWAAHSAARYHSADAWYRRRAEWTFEAVAHHEATMRGRAG